MPAPRITKEELKAKMDRGEGFLLLDVRNPTDYADSEVQIPGAKRIPLEDLEKRIGEFDPGKEVVAYCT